MWVGSLRVSVKEADLHDAFVKFGTVLSCKVMHDEEGWSRKFGYVNYSSAEDAEWAARNMNGKELHKATIKTKGPRMLEEEGHTKAPGVDYRPLTDCKFFVRSSMCTKGGEVGGLCHDTVITHLAGLTCSCYMTTMMVEMTYCTRQKLATKTVIADRLRALITTHKPGC